MASLREFEMVRGKVVKVTANSVEDALKQLPADIDVPDKEEIRAILLRSSRDVRPVDLSREPFSLFATERHRYQVLANREFDLKEIFLWEPGRTGASSRV